MKPQKCNFTVVPHSIFTKVKIHRRLKSDKKRQSSRSAVRAPSDFTARLTVYLFSSFLDGKARVIIL